MAKRRISDLFGDSWMNMSKDDVYNQTKSQYGVDLNPHEVTALYGGQQINWADPAQPVQPQSFTQNAPSVASLGEPAGDTWINPTDTQVSSPPTVATAPAVTTPTITDNNTSYNLAGQTTGDGGGAAPGDSRYMYRGSGGLPMTHTLGGYYNVNEGGGGGGQGGIMERAGNALMSIPGHTWNAINMMNPWLSIRGPQQETVETVEVPSERRQAAGGGEQGFFPVGGPDYGTSFGADNSFTLPNQMVGYNPAQSFSFEDMFPGGDTFTLPNQGFFGGGGPDYGLPDLRTGFFANPAEPWSPDYGPNFGASGVGFFDTGSPMDSLPFAFNPEYGLPSGGLWGSGDTTGGVGDAGVDPASLAGTSPWSYINQDPIVPNINVQGGLTEDQLGRALRNTFSGLQNAFGDYGDRMMGIGGFGGVNQNIANLNNRFNAFDTGFGNINNRFNDVFGQGGFGGITSDLSNRFGALDRDLGTRFGNLDTQFGDLNTRFGGLDSGVRGLADFLQGSQAGLGAFDNLYNRMGSRFDTGFNQLGGRFDTGLGVLGDRFGEDISGLQGALGQDIGGIRSKLFGDSVVGEGAFDILGNRFDTGISGLGGQMGDLSTQFGDIESKLWGNSVVGPGAFDLMGDRFTTGLGDLGRTLGQDIGGLGNQFRISDMLQRGQLGDLLSGQQGMGSDIANLLLGQQGIGEDFGQVTSDFGDVSSRFGDINARLDSFFDQAMDGGPEWLNDPMSLYEMMEPRMREDLRMMLPGEEQLLPEWMQGGERAFLDRIAPQLFPQGDLNDMLTEILGDPVAAMQNEIEQLKSGGLLAELNKLQDVDAITGGDAAGEATPFAGMAGENIFESPPELAMPEITDYTQALQMPLYNDLLESMGAASPYDTRRDEVLGGETAYLDKIYDEKRENLENRFAVMDQLGSPGFRKAMSDLEEDRAQAKLGITSEFGREAARGDEAIRRGRAQDLASALGFERGRVRDEMSFQDQLQRQATQDFNNYLDQVFRSYMAPQDSYDNALRMMLGGLGTAIQPNIGAAMTGLGGQRGAVGTYQDKMDQNMRNYQMMLNPGAFENM